MAEEKALNRLGDRSLPKPLGKEGAIPAVSPVESCGNVSRIAPVKWNQDLRDPPSALWILPSAPSLPVANRNSQLLHFGELLNVQSSPLAEELTTV